MINKNYLDLAEKIFLNPEILYPAKKIVQSGVLVTKNSATTLMNAVAANTFRGFHRINKTQDGANRIFRDFFTNPKVLNDLQAVNDRDSLDTLLNQFCEEIKKMCEKNIKYQQLQFFNKIRKPVDLYVEHLVCMAEELKDHREKLVPLLFLPLDSILIGHNGSGDNELFSNNDLREAGVNRSITYGHINKEAYYLLQNVAIEKSKKLKKIGDFHPIYYDLIWNKRYLEINARNLFESNPIQTTARQC